MKQAKLTKTQHWSSVGGCPLHRLLLVLVQRLLTGGTIRGKHQQWAARALLAHCAVPQPRQCPYPRQCQLALPALVKCLAAQSPRRLSLQYVQFSTLLGRLCALTAAASGPTAAARPKDASTRMMQLQQTQQKRRSRRKPRPLALYLRTMMASMATTTQKAAMMSATHTHGSGWPPARRR